MVIRKHGKLVSFYASISTERWGYDQGHELSTAGLYGPMSEAEVTQCIKYNQIKITRGEWMQPEKLSCHHRDTKSNKFFISVTGVALDSVYCTVNSVREGAMSIFHGFSVSKLWALLGQMLCLSHLLLFLSFESRASNSLERHVLAGQKMVDEMLSACQRLKNTEDILQTFSFLVN